MTIALQDFLYLAVASVVYLAAIFIYNARKPKKA